MSTSTISRYLFTLVLSIVSLSGIAPVYAQTDSVAAEEEVDEPPPRKKFTGGHQLALGVDVFHPVLNSAQKLRYTYEGEVSYYLKNEYYAVVEGGLGGCNVDYDDLKYTATNTFARIGFNKSVLYRERENDWDMMFIGLRAAMANINRSPSSYTVYDNIWGDLSGTSPAKSFAAIWAEITMGMRVELLHGIMAGWNIRGKFLMNGRSFDDLSPLHIAGYGKGDKNSNFDFNMYIDYAIRWDRRKPAEPGNVDKKAGVK